MRDQKRGQLVGEKTFGTGSEQQLFTLSDGGALLLTTVKYALASGKSFMEESINPTVKVERLVEADTILPDTDDDDDSDKPEQQQQPQAAPVKPPAPVEDVQLKKAFEIIKQAPAKGAAAQKRAAAKAAAAIDSAYADRMAT